ncbi:alpha-xylosidase [Treponema primitia]|uniref:alpha-xylosidase n=1 Tax=Treponema primitia TaxID=88058 RepID=UPI00025552D2|nr:alpha-xylosidase [Treponema primitia]
MKFTNGYWLLKEGIEAHYAATAIDAEKQDGALVIHAPDKAIRERFDVLNRPELTVRYSSPAKNVIRVRITHFGGHLDSGPHFELSDDGSFKGEVSVAENEAVFASGDLEARIKLGDIWDVRFSAKAAGAERKPLTKCETKSTGYIVSHRGAQYAEDPFLEFFEGDQRPYSGTYIKEELSLGVGEYIYGLGERFGPFIKNGQAIDIWNADGGTASDQAYINIPFYLTNAGYGIFVNNTGKVQFEVASEKTSRVQFSVAGENLEYFVIYGPSPKQILERYTALTGRPPLLDESTYGLWLSTSFTTNYDEATVMSFIDGMANRGIPLSVFHFDCFWMKGFHWTDFCWDDATFPDPAGMIKRIKAKGLKISLWINSYVGQRSRLFAEGRDKGYFLKKKDGSVYQTDLWQAGLAIVDFTNPAACAWYTEKLGEVLDLGIDYIKTDFGERIPLDAVYHSGADPIAMHNYYTYLYGKTVFTYLEKKKGVGKVCLFARSATVGSQKFPLHWGGDCESTFEAMAETLRGGLSLGLSGFGFWSHDIGGFEGTPDAALFKRWLAFGLLSSHSRLHGSNSYRVPWNVDEESAVVCKFFAELKQTLVPYLLEAQKETHAKGIPMMRAMLLEFPDDPVCPFLDRQYMLGPDILVAPVFSADNEVEYYLPPGTWTHLIDKDANGQPRVETGGKWLRESYGFFSLPVWRR